MALQLTDIQQVTLAAAAADAVGNAATVTEPTWSVTPDGLLSITPDETGLSALLVTTNELGSAQVTFSCKSGDQTLTATLDIIVVASDATSVSITTGHPEPRPLPEV